MFLDLVYQKPLQIKTFGPTFADTAIAWMLE